MNIFKVIDESGNIQWGRAFLLGTILLVLIGGLSVVASYTGLIAGWLNQPGELLSADNVKKEYEMFYTQQKSLSATQASIESLQKSQQDIIFLNGEDTSKWPIAIRDEYQQIGKQILQLETAYNQACADYQARWDNAFHTIAAPGDIPRTCSFTQ